MVPALPEVQEKRPRAAKGAGGKRAAAADAPPVPVRRNGLSFDIPQPNDVLAEAKPAKEARPKGARAKRACDPRLVSAARELRDRWLERVNATPALLSAGPRGKYDVSRVVDERVPAAVVGAGKLIVA